jgi:ELWxxDGT repeat protein
MHNNFAMRSTALLLLLCTFVLAAAGDAAALGASTTTSGFVVDGGVAYFSTSFAMCRTDGTPAGTLCFPVPASSVSRTVLLNGKAYALYGWWSAPQVIYEFDGASAPRTILSLPPNQLASDLGSNRSHLFYLSEGRIPGGVRLMRVDGTPGGASLVMALPTTEASTLARAGNALLLSVTDTATWKPRYGRQLWTSNGTQAGTALLLPGALGSGWTPLGGTVLFASQNQLWRTDGTQTGTFVIAGNAAPISVREPYAYFIRGQEVWRTDGTHTAALRNVGFPASFAGMAGGNFLLLATQESGTTVWSADDAGGPPVRLATIPTPGTPSQVNGIVHAGELAFFAVRISNGRYELWRSDGTAAGTFAVATLPDFRALTAVGDKVLFLANDGVHGIEPWVSDGTREGTKMLANLAPEGTVRGTVTDAATGLAIENAVVEGSGAVIRTGPDGGYTLDGAIGALTLRARTDTHLTETRELTVKAHDDLTVDFALTLGARITGRVTDSSGTPRTGYRVQVIPDAGVALTLTTDEAGRYSTPPIPVASVWTVRADTQSGHNAAAQAGIRLAAGSTHTADLTMTRFGRLRFRLVDAVSLGPVRTNRFGLVHVHHALGDHTGTYNYVNGSSVDVALPDGDYQAAMSSAVYRNRWLNGVTCPVSGCATVGLAQRGTTLRCTGDTTTSIDFVVTPVGGSVRGVLVDAESGARVFDASVSVSDSTGAYAWSGYAEEAAFESEPIFPDRLLTVTVRPGNRAYLQATAVVDMRYADNPRPEIKIKVIRGATVRGRVVDRNGNAIAGAEVLVDGRRDRTDSIGSYAIPGIATGTYTVVAKRDGYADARAEGVALTNGRKTTVHLTMDRE